MIDPVMGGPGSVWERVLTDNDSRPSVAERLTRGRPVRLLSAIRAFAVSTMAQGLRITKKEYESRRSLSRSQIGPKLISIPAPDPLSETATGEQLNSMPTGLSPEILLAATCCRWPGSVANDAAIRGAVTPIMNWDRVIEVAAAHRIEALVLAGLRRAAVTLPENVSAALARRASAIARANLVYAAEETRICRAFGQSGLDLLFVKGTTGAMLAYGTLSIKAARDIDLLVSASDAERACVLLSELGYESHVFDTKPLDGAFMRWMKHSKETLWTHPDRGTVVELHSALVDNRQVLDQVGMGSPRQLVQIGEGVFLPTLATEELFSYLCVHGTVHQWSRLKWLADVAALIVASGLSCGHLYRASLALGAGRSSAVALLLCNDLLGTHLPHALRAELRGDRIARLLSRNAMSAISKCASQPPGTESAAQLARSMALLLLANRGWRPFLGELRHRAYFPYSAKHLTIQPWLWPILSLLQLPQFALKRRRLRPG